MSRTLSGFTLIELLVLLAIIAILASIAVPNFSATIKSDRDVSQINTLLASLALARSEAIKNAGGVTICAGTDTACAGSTWADGWVVYYNTRPPGASTLIRTFPALSGSNTLTSTGGNSFTFNAQGMTGVASTFELCDARGFAYAREIDLDVTGRAEVANQAGRTITGAAILVCP